MFLNYKHLKVFLVCTTSPQVPTESMCVVGPRRFARTSSKLLIGSLLPVLILPASNFCYYSFLQISFDQFAQMNWLTRLIGPLFHTTGTIGLLHFSSDGTRQLWRALIRGVRHENGADFVFQIDWQGRTQTVHLDLVLSEKRKLGKTHGLLHGERVLCVPPGFGAYARGTRVSRAFSVMGKYRARDCLAAAAGAVLNFGLLQDCNGAAYSSPCRSTSPEVSALPSTLSAVPRATGTRLRARKLIGQNKQM